ncbi:LysR family transcriptional regulator [soil metagenome]
MPEDLHDAISDLALFVVAARGANLSKAASQGGLSVAKLSRRITALETAAGLQLLHRTGRRYGPTEEGARLLAALEGPLAGVQAAYAELTSRRAEPEGLLRLSVTADFGATFLAPLIAEFRGLYPGVRLDLDLSSRRVDLAAERYDATIRAGPLDDSGLTVRRLATVPSAFYASAGYIALRGRPQVPSDLRGHDCLPLPHMRGVARLRRGDEQAEVPVGGPVQANTAGMLRRLCGEGLGIAPLNPFLAAEGAEHCPVERILPDWTLEPTVFHMVTTTRLLPARTRAMLDFLRLRFAQAGL